MMPSKIQLLDLLTLRAEKIGGSSSSGKRTKIDLLKITKRRVTSRHCVGCRDNFYNGNNDLGVQRCWNMDSAKLVRRKEVCIYDVPPWHWQPVLIKPSCYSRKGYVYVRPHQLN